MIRNTFVILVLTALTLLTGCSSDGREKISGAGATFPSPFYNIVFREYAQQGGSITTYGGIGSGGGVRSFKDMTIDFGATDVFLSDKDLAKIGVDVVHIPAVLGGIVMAFNLDGVKELNMNAEVVTGIYMGTITKWDDKKIKAINPNIQLPNKTITPVYRSDGSGTTAVFSDYMSKANAEWKEKIGKGKALKIPAGVAAKGNPGVAGVIAETDGSIGYIGSEYALALNIPSTSMQNSSGNFIKANEKSISLSADIEIPADTRTTITNSDNPDAYPISTFSWIIVYKEQAYNGRSLQEAKALKDLMLFVISEDGQAIATKTSYAPLSGKALETTRAAIESMTYNGNKIQ